MHRFVAALTGANISSIPTDVAADTIMKTMHNNPALLVKKVQTHMSNKSESDHLPIEMEAENTLPSQLDYIDKLFEAMAK